MKNIIKPVIDTLRNGLKTQPARADLLLTDNDFDISAIQPKVLVVVQKKIDTLKEAITNCFAVELDRIIKLQKTVEDSNAKQVNIFAYICL